MCNKNFKISMVFAIVFANGVFAMDSDKEKEELDLNTIEVVEEEPDFDLGFDTAEYLPADFDAYAYPTDVQSINYIDPNDSFELDFDTSKYLPEGFDPYKRK